MYRNHRYRTTTGYTYIAATEADRSKTKKKGFHKKSVFLLERTSRRI